MTAPGNIGSGDLVCKQSFPVEKGGTEVPLSRGIFV